MSLYVIIDIKFIWVYILFNRQVFISMLYSTLWIFMIFSVLGWVFDTVSDSLSNGKFVNRGFLVGPVCPIYGLLCAGAYILNVYLCKDVFFVQLGIYSVFSAVTIFVVNYILHRLLKIRFWDFSDMQFNYKGYISLSVAIMWGIALAVVSSYVDGYICLLADELPDFVNLIVVISFMSLLFCDIVFSVLMMLGMRKRAKKLENVAGKLKKIEKNATKVIEKNTEKAKLGSKLLKLRFFVQDIFGRISLFFEKLKEKLIYNDNVFTQRIRKAYKTIMTTEGAEKLQQSAKEHMEMNMKEYEVDKNSSDDKPFAYGLSLSKLFLLFFVGSIIGCIIETCFALVTLGHFEVRVGLVYGPFIPIYGLGAVLLTLALSRFYRSSLLGLFAISGAVGATFEYFCSWVQELIFGTISWDYSDKPFNIDGRTCLSYAVMWGILGVIWVRELYPMFSRLIEKMPKKTGYVVTLVLLVFMLFDVFVSVTAQLRASERAEGIPASGAFEKYLDKRFDDDYLSIIYPNMERIEE